MCFSLMSTRFLSFSLAATLQIRATSHFSAVLSADNISGVCHGVAKDPQELDAVRDWPLPLRHLSSFNTFWIRKFLTLLDLGLQFSCGTLTKSSKNHFTLTTEATQAFHQHCHLLTLAPILLRPDPTQPFVVNVDVAIGHHWPPRLQPNPQSLLVAQYSQRHFLELWKFLKASTI